MTQSKAVTCRVTVKMQGVVQQQFVVRAVQLECKCMQHECSRQASAIQLLEAAADRRRMEERRLQHDFWDMAREALGMIIICIACSMTSGMWREKPLV